jgi:WD40 repeat protein
VLAVAAGDRATLIDGATLAPLFTFAASGPVSRVVASPGGGTVCTLAPSLAGGSASLATVQLWSTAAPGLCLESRLPGHSGDINTCHVVGRSAVTGGADGRVRVWELPSGEYVGGGGVVFFFFFFFKFFFFLVTKSPPAPPPPPPPAPPGPGGACVFFFFFFKIIF